MRSTLVFMIIVIFTYGAQAKVIGVASKFSLLQQLQMSLGISVIQMQLLPEDLLNKLPLTNEITEIKPTFFAAWTQITFLACKRAISLGAVPLLKEEPKVKSWILYFASKTWGGRPSKNEIDSIYLAGFAKTSSEADHHNKMSIVCSAVLSSPKVYVIAEEGA